MSFLAFGINHKTASVDVREKVAFDLQKLDQALLALAQMEGVSEAVILSTCNRTEIYCAGSQDLESEVLHDWLASYHGIESIKIATCSFLYREQQAISHVMRVASGLDSMVLGEPQIFGQLKSSYASALAAGTVGSELGRLFEYSFSVAKRVRSETAIGENSVSVAAAAVKMARQLFGDFSGQTALLIGAGKTTELVARHLNQAGIKRLIIANRTLSRAQELSSKVSGEAVLLGEVPDLLCETDILIASTASALPILGKGAVESALKARKHRPIFMVDLAVPRDIEPQVGELSDVYLYTVDDLRQVIDENKKSRQGAAQEAEKIVEHGCGEFVEHLRSSSAGDVLKQFRAQAESLQKSELNKALGALRGGADAESVLRNMSRSLTNKLIHEPTVQVRKAAVEGRHDVGKNLLDLFGLDENKFDD